MKRLTLLTALTLAVPLLCGTLAQIQAADTKIVVKDGGSLLLLADGLDAGKTWTLKPGELRHQNSQGVLSALQITDAGADQCAGKPTCGIDPAKPWKIQIVYNSRWVTIASVSANKGLHVKFSPKIPFTQWQKTGTADEREFGGHGDGRHISSAKVNGSATSLCSGKGGCEITVLFSPR
jgi:hypothetical protein